MALWVCLLLAVAWTSYTSTILPDRWGWDTSVKPTPMWLAQLISVPLTSLFLYGLYRLRSLHRPTIATFAIYALVFLVLFISIAPGCLTEDSYYTFYMVRNGWWNAWYSLLHPALTTAFVQILPIDFYAPGIFLALAWAATYTLMHRVLASMSAPLSCHVVVPLVLLLPAQAAAALIIIRDGFFTAGFISFLLILIWALRARVHSTRYLVPIATLGALLMLYRADAALAVIIGLYALLAIGRWRLGHPYLPRWKAAMPVIAPVLIVALLAIAVPRLLDHRWIRGNTWDARAKLEYKLTLIESPLGYIVKHGGSRISANEKAAIERVFRFDDLRDHYCPGNLCLFYGHKWNTESTPAERDRAFRAALAVFAKHPVLFLESRIATLNTVGDENSQTLCSRAIMVEKGYPRLVLSQALSEYGQKVLDYVRRTERADGILGGSRVWWNVYTNGAVVLLIALCIAWTPATSLAAFLLLVRTVVVAAMAPAGFTVYYLTLFIGAPFLLILWAAELRHRRRPEHR